MTEIVHQTLNDDGDIPNNADLPLILYKGALKTTTNNPDAEFQDLFHLNGWGNGWCDQVVFSFHHYHSQAHEVVGSPEARPGSSSVARPGPQSMSRPVTSR